ncbi:MAG: hypothetical protein ACL93V_04805 [Candidatus Electrothrix sp. YB6]
MAGLRRYSFNYFLPEIKDELVGYLSIDDVDALLKSLSYLKKTRFTLDEISECYQKTSLITRHDLYKVLNYLFDCSAIGNLDRNYYCFKYRDRHTFFNPNERIIIHRGLWKALSI